MNRSALVVAAVIVLIVGGYAAFAAISSSTGSTTSTNATTTTTGLPANSTTTTTPSTVTTATQPSGPTNVTVSLADGGWNNTALLTIHASLGQKVTITITYNDSTGDDHPLFVTGPASIPGPDMNTSNKVGQIEFTPTVAGTYEVICLNADCAIHNLINGNLQIVVS